jgi:hypothetical protein
MIVLPFTAPLHTCDLIDILGAEHDTPSAPKETRTPAQASEGKVEGDARFAGGRS